MKTAIVILLAIVVAVSGCTTLRLKEGSPEELQSLIVQGQLIQPDDWVRLVTADKKVHEFWVTKVDTAEGLIVGEKESVPVATIVTVQVLERSASKTTALVVGLVLITVGIGLGLEQAGAAAVFAASD